jgi:hypothetical protein
MKRGVSPERGFVERFFEGGDLSFLFVAGFVEAAPDGGGAFFDFGVVELRELADVEGAELVASDFVGGDGVEKGERVSGARGEDVEGGGAVVGVEGREMTYEKPGNFLGIIAGELGDDGGFEVFVVEKLEEGWEGFDVLGF